MREELTDDPISVNISPSVEPDSYQPKMSVSRVEAEIADAIFASGSPFATSCDALLTLKSMSMRGLPERFDRDFSKLINCRKLPSCKRRELCDLLLRIGRASFSANRTKEASSVRGYVAIDLCALALRQVLHLNIAILVPTHPIGGQTA